MTGGNPAKVALRDQLVTARNRRTLLERSEAARAVAPDAILRLHFHDTRNTGVANAFAAVEAGVDVLDASVGGIGGCPFAPGAAGNVASEDVVYMLEEAGIATGIDLPEIIAASQWLSGIMGRTLPGMAAQAPLFPQAFEGV